ncbi:hypothetical protein [Sphingomonas radiodurans]|uniref:hypothetical protein n=1 Tax=Sphingomonas radiodurans TaxID=2890321 RepID=UPI001E2C0D7E|nr:hypothetical protein [Sphingomonas radiodurans]WBH17383.1 hypothetical protein LLW23_04545 [Sphingomonas radiodurans]
MMPQANLPALTTVPAPAPVYHRGKIALRIGRRTKLSVGVTVTSQGLLAIGALVSSILLSTAVIVSVAVRADKS